MNNKTKKILAGIATIIIFVIGGIIYLTVPDEQENVTGGGADYEYSDDYQDEIESVAGGSDDVVDTDIDDQEAEVNTEASADNYENEDTQETETDDDYEVTYEFRKQQYLDEHFEKHGSEFDYNNADEYLAGANRVINDPNSLYKTEAEDGDHIYYLESTNEFVVVSTDGYIRTYFRPSAGKAYFDRQ